MALPGKPLERGPRLLQRRDPGVQCIDPLGGQFARPRPILPSVQFQQFRYFIAARLARAAASRSARGADNSGQSPH
jgi:hypothetical protein